MYKKRFIISALLITAVFFIAISLQSFIMPFQDSYYDYGVFLGINGNEIQRMEKYSVVVLEPTEFNSEQISKLKSEGKTVYGYINIGALEEYRPYFKDFSDLSLGVYKNWEDERWIDVSDLRWQNFIIKVLGKEYAALGLDGFFADNADVYYNFPDENIFYGLCSILKGLQEYNLTIIINGGDSFVSRCISEGSAASLFSGINQECVFTSIDFENETYGRQIAKDTEYYTDYLSDVKDCNLSVFLLEYSADPLLCKEIDEYCAKNSFFWYNAKSLKLD